jgi:RNA recognition motif-containing protein
MTTASRCIFVGNIPYDYDDQSLIETLSMVGPINNFRIVFDELTGKSKGYGFCEYRDAETAASALRNLKSIDYNGRQLRINVAENDKTGINLTEDMIRAGKDISYIKETKATSENKFSDLLKNLTDEQKLLLFHGIKTLSDKDSSSIKNLLMNQSEEFLVAVKDAQAEYINKFNLKQKAQINKIV